MKHTELHLKLHRSWLLGFYEDKYFYLTCVKFPHLQDIKGFLILILIN